MIKLHENKSRASISAKRETEETRRAAFVVSCWVRWRKISKSHAILRDIEPKRRMMRFSYALVTRMSLTVAVSRVNHSFLSAFQVGGVSE